MDRDTYTDCARSQLGERVVFPRSGDLPLNFWERDYWAELELVSTDLWDGTKTMRMRAPKSKEGMSWLEKCLSQLFKWLSEQIRGRTQRTG